MVLVEEGPWDASIEDQLRRIQRRLYGCLDAILDGQLAEKFPDSKGARVSIQLECFNVPRPEVEDFFDRFSSQVLLVDDYRRDLASNAYTSGIDFKIAFQNIH